MENAARKEAKGQRARIARDKLNESALYDGL